jgi:hypothetical protein
MSQWQELEDLQVGVVGLTRLPVGKPLVPGIIKLEEDHLHWSHLRDSEPVSQTEIHLFPGTAGDAQTIRNVPLYEDVDMPEVGDFTGALARFARLRTGEDVLRFAQRYGVLGLCQHGMPETHNPRPLSVPLLGLIQSPSLWKPVEVGTEREPSFVIEDRGERPWCEAIRCEPVEVWLFWSRMSSAMLNVAASLRRNVPTKQADWEVIITEETDERSLLIDSILARPWIARIYLQEAVNRWLHLGNVRLSMSWSINSENPSLEIEAETFGLLGVQLLTAVTGAQSLSLCDGCDRPYVREGRRPQTGRANYCPDCRKSKVPERERQRRRRARAT